MRRLIILATGLFVGLVCSMVTPLSAQDSAPLPDDISISPPSSDLSDQQADFSGKWAGSWGDGTLDHILVVERVEPPQVSVIYSFGSAWQWNIDRPGWFRTTGTLNENVLTLSLRSGLTKVTYTLNADGSLDATYLRDGRTTLGKLNRVGSRLTRAKKGGIEEGLIAENQQKQDDNKRVGQDLPEFIPSLRESDLYEHVGKGRVYISERTRKKLLEFDNKSSSSLFFITEDGFNTYMSWCGSSCSTYGNPLWMRQACEKKFGKKCYLYKIGSPSRNPYFREFSNKIVWDFWAEESVAEEQERKRKEEEARRLAEEQERKRKEEEARRLAEEPERKRKEEEARRLAEAEKTKKEEERRLAELEKRNQEQASPSGVGGGEELKQQLALLQSLKDSGILDEREYEGKKSALINQFFGLKQNVANIDAAQLAKFAGVAFGNYHALVIGNNEYAHLPELKTAVNDAQTVAKVLREEYAFNVSLLLNADRNQILDALDVYREKLGELDNLLIYYAGHGWLDEDAAQGYWLPVDAKEHRRSDWISNADISATMRALDAKHVMVVADSCYSGTLVRGMRLAEKSADYIQRMAVKRARVVLTSGGLEPVADLGGSGHSPFAKAFIDTLSENRSVMDGTTLFSQLRRSVMLNADQTPEYSDARRAGHDGGDFLFVRKR